MKKNNIKKLKEMVNANVLETVETVAFGVQAYNISDNEYEVITKFAKINGRYYFIDRDGNKYLASRYDRAELVARDILDNLEYARQTAYEDVCTLEEKKQVFVNGAYLSLFLDFCDLFGFDVESVENHFHNNGEMYTVYRLKSEQTAENNAQSEETAADDQQTESEATATTCEPSAFSRILAKVKGSARKVFKKVAFVMSFIFIVAVSLLAFYYSVLGICEGLDIFGIDGAARVVCAIFLLLTVGVEIAVNVEQNVTAVIDRLFPSIFHGQKPVPFAVPFTYWYRIIKDFKK